MRLRRVEIRIMARDFKHKELTDKAIKCVYEVYNVLGYGFLEKVYEKALILELRSKGFNVTNQHKIEVFYKGKNVGDYYADLCVNHTLIIELKAAAALCDEHYYQLINYLTATDIEVGLLLNFGKKPEIKRVAFTNSRKLHHAF